ncbi:MAG: glycosyl hydrolase [Marinoscillum sp.]
MHHTPSMLKACSSLVLLTISLGCLAQKAEAESGTLTGTVIGNSHAGFSGEGYVTSFDNDNDAVSIPIEVAQSGLYDLWVGYAGPNGEKTNDIYVNGTFVGGQIFPESQAFQESYFGKIILEPGKNRIRVVKNWGYFELDYVRVAPTNRNEIHNYPEQLIHPSPSSEAQVLYQFFRDYYGHRIISGQQATLGGSTEVNYLENLSGHKPAMKGFDLIDYSPSRVAHGTTSLDTEEAIKWWTESHGIVSMMWHWNAPMDLIDTEEARWWSGFYSYATTFDPTIAMNDPNSEHYEVIMRDIDAIAVQLKRLQASNVPVLWRPLHEAEGTWFWWGDYGPEVCIWLWKLMYDRLTNEHDLNNLIWVWTGTNSEEALDWYPGDDYVDIIGADIYLEDKNYAANFSMFDDMAGIHEGKKVISLSETGTIPDPDALADQQARWSWFMVWSGDFIIGGGKNDLDHIIKVYQHEYVITLDELPDFSNYQSPEFPDDVLSTDKLVAPSVRVFPNPTAGLVYIDLKKTTANHIMLYDLKGKQMHVDVVKTKDQCVIDLSSLPKGTYIIAIESGLGIRFHRVWRH